VSVSRIFVDRAGFVRAAKQVPSPNCDERPQGVAVSLLVVHNISLPPGRFGGPAIAALFTNRLDPSAHPYFATVAALRVSAHFVIGRDGALTQFVSCARRAWHALRRGGVATSATTSPSESSWKAPTIYPTAPRNTRCSRA